MQSIFRYPGGKTKKQAKQWILDNAPGSYEEYREPFVGGGGIYFSIDKAKRRWINDKDEYLISVYEALKNDPEIFIAKCKAIPPYVAARKDEERERLRKVFDEVAFNPETYKALRYFFVNRTVFAGRVNYERKSRLYFSKPEGWTAAVIDRLTDAAQLLRETKVTCDDYATLLSAPGENVWIYCDPPYVKPLKSTSLLYRLNFEQNADHEKFAEAVKRSPHKVAVSYEDDPDGLVRSLFKGFTIKEKMWTYAGTWSPDQSGKDRKRRGKELLILNY